MEKDRKLKSLEHHLKGLRELGLCEDLNNAVSEWEQVLEIDTYIKDGVMYVSDETYSDVITFIYWEIYKIRRMLRGLGIKSSDVEMNLDFDDLNAHKPHFPAHIQEISE